jgi:mannose-6-phosphate isomerase-like protein (cupin superfamily)
MMRLHLAVLAVAACLPLLPSMASAQSVDTYSTQKFAQIKKDLEPKADQAGGDAALQLQKYPNHHTMISFRNKSGKGELHEQDADVMFILDGSTTLVTGGSLVNPKTTAPNEVRGDSVKGGTSVTLHKGDVVHIPANTPHQMLLPAGGSVEYFVVKVQK